jgi:hypothetical protein
LPSGSPAAGCPLCAERGTHCRPGYRRVPAVCQGLLLRLCESLILSNRSKREIRTARLRLAHACSCVQLPAWKQRPIFNATGTNTIMIKPRGTFGKSLKGRFQRYLPPFFVVVLIAPRRSSSNSHRSTSTRPSRPTRAQRASVGVTDARKALEPAARISTGQRQIRANKSQFLGNLSPATRDILDRAADVTRSLGRSPL